MENIEIYIPAIIEIIFFDDSIDIITTSDCQFEGEEV